MAKGSETGGCLNCYAARMASRHLPGLMSSTGKPLARILQSGPRWTGEVEVNEKAIGLPLHWRKPRRIFVNSMSDLFHEALSDYDLLRIFTVMGNTHVATGIHRSHILQVLTKRAGRMFDFCSRLRWRSGFGFCEIGGKPHIVNNMPYLVDLPNSWVSIGGGDRDPVERPEFWMPPNLWLGVSVENQQTADARIPLLLRTPAAIRFVSYEPALGPIVFKSAWLKPNPYESVSGSSGHSFSGLRGNHPELMTKINQIIIGGESGPGARPFDFQWARDTRDQCKAAGAAFFFKQAGAFPLTGRSGLASDFYFPGEPAVFTDYHRRADGEDRWRVRLRDKKGGDITEWPTDLRIREFPTV